MGLDKLNRSSAIEQKKPMGFFSKFIEFVENMEWGKKLVGE